MIISMIAAMTKHRVIGKDNEMPWHLPADFVWFKRCTMGKPIIMGRKTFDSIGRPLPGRKNIVITRQNNMQIDGVEVVSSIGDAIALVEDQSEVMIIGGGSIYRSCLDKANRLYITEIDADIEGDTCFPAIDSSWKETHREHYYADDKNKYDMDFVILEKGA
ncbi:type 3 dihydrofolate reductase [Vibrio sp.]|uniref:Dihydrofolate reductase n=1 Tax=Vibrio viridaestus TaxID=2487322 RepID=A0A3N9TGG0_9VIBR|nr:type 3 dihydrofolate reductase [Vibrio viridaestus]MDC0611798.1 type 3 dihydrofolate reductase [Vibrio sp.]RQW62843.1 type 3 dihydrofolate reductase [Vibrio viridaestus]